MQCRTKMIVKQSYRLLSPVSCVVGGVVLACGHTKLSSESMAMAIYSFSLLVVVSRLATRGSLAHLEQITML